ncbi:MAG: hypothetical protein COB02_17065 [Candidatus Cloacimonadota bacterium]|nr:MAG: hypothetical protein COB02_17065 [Candidatus Cloacimonadota bacterium]
MKKRDTMKAVDFDKIHFQKLENNKIELSTTCQILDSLNKPVKNSILVSSILNSKLECSTDENGYTKVISIQEQDTPLLASSKKEIQSIFKVLFNTSLMMKESIKKEILSNDEKLQEFPLGGYSFERLIKENKLYVDKTKYIYDLISVSKACFISRPRRFGKSLVISTLESLFKGKKALFEGLEIEKTNYSFEEYPVIRLDFSSTEVSSREECKELIHDLLSEQIKEYGYYKSIKNYSSFLKEFSKFTNKEIIVLVDEYDKPILDNVTKENALEIQKELKSFFGATKSAGDYIKFLFVTGITKFSNASMFSEGNHITDLGRHEKFDSMFGYTQEELEDKFNPYIEILSKKEKHSKEKTLEKVRKYYNGYTFSNRNKAIYNPYSILELFSANEFNNYWFKSGTPTFLFDLLKVKSVNFSKEGGIEASNEIFEFSKLDSLSVKALMFQAGYLIIKQKIHDKKYILDFPNTEVKESFYDYFLRELLDDSSLQPKFVEKIQEALITRNMTLLKETFNAYIKKVPYTIHAKKDEPYYQTILHCLIVCSSYYPNAEMATNDGRSDHIISTKNRHYCIEYKMTSKNECPIEQIKEKKYYRAIQPTDKTIDLIGIKFDANGNIVEDIMIEELKE